MCNICKKIICPPACPSYDGRSSEHGRRVAICRICGEAIYIGEGRLVSRKNALCSRCYLRERKAKILAAHPIKKYV